jgi:hypothetical protein
MFVTEKDVRPEWSSRLSLNSKKTYVNLPACLPSDTTLPSSKATAWHIEPLWSRDEVCCNRRDEKLGANITSAKLKYKQCQPGFKLTEI